MRSSERARSPRSRPNTAVPKSDLPWRGDVWGRGYIAEALPALLEQAFGPLGLHRLEADVGPRNIRSIQALERTGFRREGYLRQRYHAGGEVQDAVLYGLLAPDWEELRNTAAPASVSVQGSTQRESAAVPRMVHALPIS